MCSAVTVNLSSMGLQTTLSVLIVLFSFRNWKFSLASRYSGGRTWVSLTSLHVHLRISNCSCVRDSKRPVCKIFWSSKFLHQLEYCRVQCLPSQFQCGRKLGTMKELSDCMKKTCNIIGYSIIRYAKTGSFGVLRHWILCKARSLSESSSWPYIFAKIADLAILNIKNQIRMLNKLSWHFGLTDKQPLSEWRWQLSHLRRRHRQILW